MTSSSNIFHRKHDSLKVGGGIPDNNNNSEIEYENNNSENLGGDDDSNNTISTSSKHFWNDSLFGSLLYFSVHVGLIIITFVVLSIWLSYEVSECPMQ